MNQYSTAVKITDDGEYWIPAFAGMTAEIYFGTAMTISVNG